MIDIIFQNDNLAVINKPCGLLVHKTNQNDTRTTLVNLIINQWPIIKSPPTGGWPDPTRPGIVHRLDQDTSGLIIIAKNPDTLLELQSQFKTHQIEKKYLSLVIGDVRPKEGEIVTQISANNSKNIKKKATHFSFSWQKPAKTAVSNYRIIQKFTYDNQTLSLLEVSIKTGRTHQIRAQMQSKKWPIIGDQVYNTKLSKQISEKLGLRRQFLHSKELTFKIDEMSKTFSSKLPSDLQKIIVMCHPRAISPKADDIGDPEF